MRVVEGRPAESSRAGMASVGWTMPKRATQPAHATAIDGRVGYTSRCRLPTMRLEHAPEVNNIARRLDHQGLRPTNTSCSRLPCLILRPPRIAGARERRPRPNETVAYLAVIRGISRWDWRWLTKHVQRVDDISSMMRANPPITIGRFVLDRNPATYFAEIEAVEL